MHHFDLSYRSRIKISGEKSAEFLHSICTNEIKSLKDGESAGAAFADRFGKTIALSSIYNCGSFFLVESDSKAHENLLKYLDKLGGLSDCKVEDLKKTHMMFSVINPESGFLKIDFSGKSIVEKTVYGVNYLVAKNCFLDRLDFFFEYDNEKLFKSLMEKNNVPQASETEYKNFRIENKVPEFGVDFDETYLAVELGFENIVSYVKGCYTGQEIMARMKTYSGQLSKKIVKIKVESGKVIEKGKIFSGREEAGFITSVGNRACLATVKKGFFEKGKILETENKLNVVVD